MRNQSRTITQDWRCEFCGQNGRYDHEASEDAVSVWNTLKERHAIASERCSDLHDGNGLRLAPPRVQGGV